MNLRTEGQILTRPQRLAWLRLIRTDNVGPNTFRQLLNRYGSAETALEQLHGLVRRSGTASPPRVPSLAEAEDEVAAIEKRGARLIASPPQAGLAQLYRSGPPDPTPTGHLFYAIQWFAFAAMALVIYPLALRKRWRGEASG